MAFEFSTATIETIQKMAYPLVLALTGFDATAWVGDKSELFNKIGEAFGDISTLFLVIGTALEDGILTSVEIEAIIAKAETLPAAIEEIIGFFKDEPVVTP